MGAPLSLWLGCLNQLLNEQIVVVAVVGRERAKEEAKEEETTTKRKQLRRQRERSGLVSLAQLSELTCGSSTSKQVAVAHSCSLPLEREDKTVQTGERTVALASSGVK